MTEIDYSSPKFIETQRQDLIESAKDFPFFELMGIELVEIEPGRAKMRMAWRKDLCQPAGILHGGAMASLVDTSVAHSILLTARYLQAKAKGAGLVSVDLRIKYLRPVSSGLVICEARAPRVGRQITHTTAVVSDADGKEVAIGDSIYMIVSGEQLQKKSAGR
ncbi:MAG: PaaI family thioesterase [Planctomycetia bacterium]|nr:PaaI family thioesterase [Planctomycetia bacterium]